MGLKSLTVAGLGYFYIFIYFYVLVTLSDWSESSRWCAAVLSNDTNQTTVSWSRSTGATPPAASSSPPPPPSYKPVTPLRHRTGVTFSFRAVLFFTHSPRALFLVFTVSWSKQTQSLQAFILFHCHLVSKSWSPPAFSFTLFSPSLPSASSCMLCFPLGSPSPASL